MRRLIPLFALLGLAACSSEGSALETVNSAAPVVATTTTVGSTTTLAHRGQVQRCPAGQVFSDANGDGWGNCSTPVVGAPSGRTGRVQRCDDGKTFDDADGDGWGYCVGAPATTIAPVTPEQFAATLVGPVTAWLEQPSAAAFDAVSAAARSLAGGSLPVSSGPQPTADLLAGLSTYPGNDGQVGVTIYYLRDLLPGIPTLVPSSNYQVGVSIEPGTYRTVGPVDGCYWETLDDAGEINDNNFVNAAPQVIMRVRTSDYAVNMDGCGVWVKTD